MVLTDHCHLRISERRKNLRTSLKTPLLFASTFSRLVISVRGKINFLLSPVGRSGLIYNLRRLISIHKSVYVSCGVGRSGF